MGRPGRTLVQVNLDVPRAGVGDGHIGLAVAVQVHGDERAAVTPAGGKDDRGAKGAFVLIFENAEIADTTVWDDQVEAFFPAEVGCRQDMREVPRPSPSSTDTVSANVLAVTRSGRPSALKSPVITCAH